MKKENEENIWLRQFAKDIGNEMVNSTVLYEDNQGAIQLSRNPQFHNRTKHIDVAFHFIRERIESKEIDVLYCPTKNMLADIMTKGLIKQKFEKFRNLLCVFKVD